MKHWIHRAINYQINLRAMAAREPRNPFEAMDEQPLTMSPLAYVTEKMEQLLDLGVTVLHLMPPFTMGVEQRKGIGSPYAIQDYRSINPEFGTEAELAEFVRKAHRLGFKVIIGMVPNHTSPDNVWTKSNPDYYVKDKDGKITYDLDWHDTAKLDYTQPGLRKAMLEIYDYWLSFLGEDEQGQPDGVDGFRIDMAHFINDCSFWDEVLPKLKEKHQSRELLFMAECYGTDNNKDLFKRGMNAAYDDDFYKALIYLYGRAADGSTALLPDEEAAMNNGDFRPKYEAFKAGGLAAAVEKCLMDYEEELPPVPGAPCLARYTDNHDEGRGVYRVGAGAVQAMMRLAFLTPHSIPFLYCGQEFGAENRPPIHERIQPCDKGYRMQFAGGGVFYREGVEFEGNLYARGIEARQAWFRFYQELIKLRKSEPALTDGDFSLLDAQEDGAADERQVIAFTRMLDGQTLTCAVNLGPTARMVKATELLSGEPVYGAMDAGGVLPPFAAVVLRS